MSKQKKSSVDGGFATFELIDAAFPFYLRGYFSLASLKRQKFNRAAFLPYFKNSKHHAPAYWRVGDLLAWFPRRFPQLPARDAVLFAVNLREVALSDPPLTPTRPSRAGRREKWRKVK